MSDADFFIVDGNITVSQAFQLPEKWVEVRGQRVNVANSHPMFVLCLALYALEDPRVDAVLRASNVTMSDGDGRTIVFPPSCDCAASRVLHERTCASVGAKT